MCAGAGPRVVWQQANKANQATRHTSRHIRCTSVEVNHSGCSSILVRPLDPSFAAGLRSTAHPAPPQSELPTAVPALNAISVPQHLQTLLVVAHCDCIGALLRQRISKSLARHGRESGEPSQCWARSDRQQPSHQVVAHFWPPHVARASFRPHPIFVLCFSPAEEQQLGRLGEASARSPEQRRPPSLRSNKAGCQSPHCPKNAEVVTHPSTSSLSVAKAELPPRVSPAHPHFSRNPSPRGPHRGPTAALPQHCCRFWQPKLVLSNLPARYSSHSHDLAATPPTTTLAPHARARETRHLRPPGQQQSASRI